MAQVPPLILVHADVHLLSPLLHCGPMYLVGIQLCISETYVYGSLIFHNRVITNMNARCLPDMGPPYLVSLILSLLSSLTKTYKSRDKSFERVPVHCPSDISS